VNHIQEYIDALIHSNRLGPQVVYHSEIPHNPPVWSENRRKPLKRFVDLLQSAGIERLFKHQADAIDTIAAHRHIVVSTPTASGKTIIYNLPVFDKILRQPHTKALYIFPLKALAQDQLRTFSKMAAAFGDKGPLARIYDGDTTAWYRKKIRENPPHVVFTNPEMIHLSLLPHHTRWTRFLSAVEFVVVDEVHTYRGIMGSHMAQVFRRLRRICTYYGQSPTFIFSSATVGNPAELAGQLTGLDVQSISKSGAPQGRRHIVFVDSLQSPAQTAILLLKAALHRGLRTIVYTQSRKLTELIAVWAGSQSGPYAGKISAYRAGFLPEERRKIEEQLSNGDLLAVISTSALELGIDIGDLDLCILVGYPGTIVSTWQRSGRVGRSGQDSALVMVAGEDALDQYLIRNPDELLKRQPEAAVVNPHNRHIMEKHLVCAASELPLQLGEPYLNGEENEKVLQKLEKSGKLLKSEDGAKYYANGPSPHRFIDLRGTGNRFVIISNENGENKGEIDGFRAFKETHPGAIYLHRGDTYLVDTLDVNTHTVKVSPADVRYYTRVRSHKETEIIEITAEKELLGTNVYIGRLKVTDQVTGYEKRSIHSRKRLNIFSLDLPPLIFETDGLWFTISPEIQKATESDYRHFMGGIHAVEHAAIGIFPLLVMADRNDLGGISIPYHPQVGSAAVFIYDGVPGGAGLAKAAFDRAKDLLVYTRRIIATCDCETGCPSCVHSPKCSSENRPIDKNAAIFLLDQLISGSTIPKPPSVAPPDELNVIHQLKTLPDKKAAGKKRRIDVSDAIRIKRGKKRKRFRKKNNRVPATPGVQTEKKPDLLHFGVFDIETQRSAKEVGGWHRAHRMGISCVVLYDSLDDTYLEYMENQVPELIERLKIYDLVIGFNIKRFDYHVLKGYSQFDFRQLSTLDILEEVHKRLGYRLSLNHLAKETLGTEKSGDGLQALQWWKEGRIREIIKYCRMDVQITRDLFRFGKRNGYLLFRNKAQKVVRIPVEWQ